MVEVIVVTRNSAEHIGPCVDSILAGAGLPIIVDNNSDDDTARIVRSRSPEVRVIATNENLGYGKAMNLGFKETRGKFVILSNPDVVFLGDAIRKMVEFLEKNERVGIVGPQQMFPDRSWQASYGDLPGIWSGIKDVVGIVTMHNAVRRGLWPRRVDRKPKEVPYVDGAVLTVRREAFQAMAGFDENFFMYSDESDLCARLRKAGWGVMFLPAAEVIHVRGASVAKEGQAERFARYIVKNQFLLATKHLSPWKARIYAKLQVGRFIRLRLTYRLLQWLSGQSSSNMHKIAMFEACKRIWKEVSRSPKLVHALEARPDECKDCKGKLMKKDETGTKAQKESWDGFWRRQQRLYVYRNVVKAAESFLGEVKGRSVLEVGCGRGTTLLEFARRGANAVGLDYSEEALAVCRKLESRDGAAGRTRFVHGDAINLPFPAESFDFVFSVGLVEHFRDPSTILAEQHRVLRAGGYLLVQVPQKYSMYTVVKRVMIRLGKWPYGGWETEYSDQEISALVKETGLEPEYVYGYGSFLLAAARHVFLPTLDFGMFWRDGTELDTIRALKAKTALDICVVARKK